ncbi:MAG: hypothetical protein KDF58_11550 [Alphaproteobacteria bacterium]|nr:hypothetical protein [Alphaproteobacteria bacterium]
MILRRFMQHVKEQNWFAVGLDMIVVILGILIALGIDEWRQDQEDLALEINYAQNLISDLDTDREELTDYRDTVLAQKSKMLEAILTIKEVPDDMDVSLFTIRNIDYSGYRAIPTPNNTTFREVENSSHFRLIRKDELRKAISLYYDKYQQNYEILSTPLGRYQVLIAETFPGQIYMKSFLGEEELSPEVVRNWLRKFISHPEFEAAINAEFYYTTDQIFWINRILEQGADLEQSLKAAYK